jgi:hypothetical protein
MMEERIGSDAGQFGRPAVDVECAVGRPSHNALGGLYMFLRNEPTVLEGDFLCIALICKYFYRLQSRFAGGFVLENEPTGEGF